MEFGQKNFGGQATQSAGSVSSGASSGSLDMGADSSKVKMGILGGIVAVFGIGAAVALSGGDEKVAAQQQAKADQQQMMTPTETAAVSAPAPDAGVDPNAVAMTSPPAGDQMAAPEVTAPATEQMAAPALAPESKVAMNPEPATQAPKVGPAAETAAVTEPVALAESSSAAPAPEPAVEQTAEQTADAQAASVEKPRVAPTHKQLPQAADALDAWWQKSEANTSGFGVQFVGQAADQPSLVIRLSQLADPNVAAQHIKIKAADGSEVASNWQKGANDYVLVNPNLAPGRYTVSIDPALTSTTGSALGTPLNGPIYIQ